MTRSEFIEMMKECFPSNDALRSADQACNPDLPAVPKHYVYGLQGLADLLGCSKSQAARIKQSGVIDPAISQFKKTIIVDADLAVDLLSVRKSLKKPGKK